MFEINGAKLFGEVQNLSFEVLSFLSFCSIAIFMIIRSCKCFDVKMQIQDCSEDFTNFTDKEPRQLV